MAVLSGLEPKEVFAYFEKLCSVPHGSYNTKRISDLCDSFARELGLKYRQDQAENVVIWKDASRAMRAPSLSFCRATSTWCVSRQRAAPRIWPGRDWTW